MRSDGFDPTADHPGGCYTCRYFGSVSTLQWRAPIQEASTSDQARRGCAFWEREPGADDDLPMPKPQARAIIAPMLLYMR